MVEIDQSVCSNCHRRVVTEVPRCARCGTARPGSGWPIDLLLGSQVGGRFEVTEIIGRGGFGTVYEAVHRLLGGRRAIKVLRQDLSHENTVYERFRREANVLYQLRAPQLVKVEDFGQLDDGRPYMVMELVNGERLDRLIRADGEFDALRVIRLTRQLLLALAEAHAAGILHRDLKSENIILVPSEDGTERLKLLDLGISYLLGSSKRLTRATRTIGTPEYMSIEQWMGLDDIDGRADLYSLGVLMYEMLAARVPFPREEVGGSAAIYDLVRKGDVVPISAYRQDLPRGLEGLVHRLLSADREFRPATAGEALAELERVRAGMK
ncbi:MAG: serine/threonine protein kinase [Myxococcales bacterium]|nr:serine/threonine protein kinase [Myxococcales bacterium]